MRGADPPLEEYTPICIVAQGSRNPAPKRSAGAAAWLGRYGRRRVRAFIGPAPLRGATLVRGTRPGVRADARPPATSLPRLRRVRQRSRSQLAQATTPPPGLTLPAELPAHTEVRALLEHLGERGAASFEGGEKNHGLTLCDRHIPGCADRSIAKTVSALGCAGRSIAKTDSALGCSARRPAALE